ncbi:MAG: hypothetical protein ACR2J8_12315, partial [Thermomicrobiales bacterium]
IDSPSLIVSLKYGEADFFRFLDLNPLFFHGTQRKLIEFQTRREYEGMGEFPAFTGWLYEHYLRALRDGGARIAGCYVLQAGGWSPWSRFAYCGDRSIWNELNAAVTAQIWRGESVEQAIRFWAAQSLPAASDPDSLLAFLHHADAAIERGLYIRAFAERPVYFRRVRIPPLIWVFWRDVTATGIVALLHRHLVNDRAAAVAEGHQAVAHVEAMCALAPGLGLPLEDLEFQLDTFRLLAFAREALLGLDTPDTWRAIAHLLPAYQDRYPNGYRFAFGPSPLRGVSRLVPIGFRLALRSRSRYRLRDRLLLSAPVSRGKRWLAGQVAGSLPVFANQKGMSADTLLR